MNTIPESFQDLLRDETKAYAFLATMMDDDSPQVTPVWFNWDGQNILINSALGRTKDRNMRKRPQVALAIADPNNPYRYMQIRGTVFQITEEGAQEHINQLSAKYTGDPVYKGGGQRVIYRIRINSISTKD